MGHCLMMRKGEVHTAPVTGVLASSLAVGSTVKLMEGGTAVEYLVVNQGIPENSSLYDASCDGTWLLRKDIHSERQWRTPNLNSYEYSDIHSWLNGDFFNSFGTAERAVIKQVKIPYRSGHGDDGTIQSGTNGLSCKVFLLSGPEIHYENRWIDSSEGAALDYFASCAATAADSTRIAYLSGTATKWWTRSQSTRGTINVWYVGTEGDASYSNTYVSYGIRPALVLPSNALFDGKTKLLMGVK